MNLSAIEAIFIGWSGISRERWKLITTRSLDSEWLNETFEQWKDQQIRFSHRNNTAAAALATAAENWPASKAPKGEGFVPGLADLLQEAGVEEQDEAASESCKAVGWTSLQDLARSPEAFADSLPNIRKLERKRLLKALEVLRLRAT